MPHIFLSAPIGGALSPSGDQVEFLLPEGDSSQSARLHCKEPECSEAAMTNGLGLLLCPLVEEGPLVLHSTSVALKLQSLNGPLGVMVSETLLAFTPWVFYS